MLASFKQFYQEKKLFENKEKILLAVSGGVDSMVMVDLFAKANLLFGIAHCNFQLRGKESDTDEQFVKSKAEDLGVPFFKIRFDTEAAAAHYKTSIQIVARDLRYKWLQDIRTNNNFHYIATAHHLNDSLETVIYNLSKGCGIRGLHGIPLKKETIIRPLLFASRGEIVSYAQENNVLYREDASNTSTKYKRNLIRQEVIPVLQTINPSLIKTFERTLHHLQETEILFEEAIHKYKQEVMDTSNDVISINLKPLLSHPAKSTILYELVKFYGFHAAQVDQMLSNQTLVGAICQSVNHELLKDREKWLLRAKKKLKENHKLVNKNNSKVQINTTQFTFQILQEVPTKFPKDSSTVFLDLENLSFPLLIRTWIAGDRFQPIGMNGKHKKVQDLLSDQKLNRFEKEEVLVIESDGQIVWVVGIRMDERFKVQPTTRAILNIRFFM